MAIPFLNNITLNNNEIQNVRLHNTGASNAAAGQIFFNTGVNLAQYYANGIDQWVSLKEYSFGNGTYINANVTGTAAKPIITPDLSATAVTGNIDATKYLRGDNKWAEVTSIYVWTLQGDTGGPTDILNTTAVSIVGGTNVTTALAGSTLTINSTDQFVGTLTGVGPGTYITIDNTNPAVPIINADGTVAETGLNKLVARNAAGYGYVVTPPSGDSTTKIATTAFVQAALTGLLEFKGGFRADTGQITSGANYVPGVGNETYLWGASRVAVEVGDYYIASGAFSGDFYGDADYPLTPGDSVIGVTDALVDTSVVGDWAVVQSDTDLATLATVGIGNVNAGTGIDVSYASGTATVSLTAVAARSGSIAVPTSTTYTYPNSITTASTNDVLIQLVDSGTGETVYADVTRLSTTTFSVDYGVTEPTGVIALIQLIG